MKTSSMTYIDRLAQSYVEGRIACARSLRRVLEKRRKTKWEIRRETNG
jgi:hypothetical protein